MDFFRTLRHELRTPINHIVGYSELLLESADDFAEADLELVPDLRKIQAAGKELLGLIDAFFRPSRGDDVDEMDLPRVCHELRTPLTTVIGYSDLLLEDVGERGHPELLSDLWRIRSAGAHLLGLVDAVLGLSGDGEGSVCTLPGGPAAVTPPELTPSEAEARRALSNAPVFQGGRVLVVEDNELSRDMLSRRLQRLGHTVSVAVNGRQALEKLRAASADVLLLDILMPEMDGYQVLRHLKADPELRHLPVIVLSSSGAADDAVRCIELGAEDYLPKPFDPVLLRARIGACLERKRLRDQEAVYVRQIEEEKKRSDELLHVILPHEIVDELKMTNAVRPRRYDEVAVLFCDIAGFTSYCDTHQPEEVVSHLQEVVEEYEQSALRHGMQKVKTIGDAFMAVAGLLRPVENPVLTSIKCALEMIVTTRRLPPHWEVRVGVHVGPVVAGVIGNRQYLFDLWGDTVNTAARMESNGTPGAIALSRAAWERVSDICYGESRGFAKVKGKGEQEIFLFAGLRD